MTHSLFPRSVCSQRTREIPCCVASPWICSSGVARMEGKARSGETIDIVDHQENGWPPRRLLAVVADPRPRVTFDRNEAIDSALL